MCVSVNDYSHATGYDTVYEHYQQIQCYNCLKNKTAIFLVADLVTWPNPLISVTHVYYTLVLFSTETAT